VPEWSSLLDHPSVSCAGWHRAGFKQARHSMQDIAAVTVVIVNDSLFFLGFLLIRMQTAVAMLRPRPSHRMAVAAW
jgi:hypothetical protein